MKVKLSMFAVALISLVALSACKKEQEASTQVGQDAAAAINSTLDKAKDAAKATEDVAKATTEQAAAAASEAKADAVDAVQAAKDAAKSAVDEAAAPATP